MGTGNPTEQTNITPQQLQQALNDAVRAGSNVAGDPLVDALSAVGGLLKDVAEAVLASGVAVGGDGISVGGVGGGGQSQDQFNQEVADSLARDLGESFRSEVVPTLLGNQPGQAQIGSADPDPGGDDETAQAPAAAVRVQLATEGTQLTLATESTLESVNAFAAQIAANTNILTQLPIIESLAGQGVSTEDAQSNLNLGERQTDLLTLLQSAQSLAGPGPDLSRMGSPDAPLHIKDVDIATPRRVEVVNMPEVKIANTAKVEVTNDVNVKQVGVVQVTQSGEWVMQLASGQTIPVYVQGGSVQANLSQGGISTLAELIDVENQRRDAFNTAI